MHHPRHCRSRWSYAGAMVLALAMAGISPGYGIAAFDAPSLGAARGDELVPQTPAAFLPGGMLGIQLGGSWQASKQNHSLHQLACQSTPDASDFDEVCFFRTSADSRVAGAEIHDGFIVRKDDHVVLVGAGITIKNADDPLAESVVQTFRSKIHADFQHTGANILFATLPARHLTAEELAGFTSRAPVLLVQLEVKTNELAVLYGYLGPVNVFGALASD
jgi:hypothetical protein